MDNGDCDGSVSGMSPPVKGLSPGFPPGKYVSLPEYIRVISSVLASSQPRMLVPLGSYPCQEEQEDIKCMAASDVYSIECGMIVILLCFNTLHRSYEYG